MMASRLKRYLDSSLTSNYEKSARLCSRRKNLETRWELA
jgi:hypothetical protein